MRGVRWASAGGRAVSKPMPGALARRRVAPSAAQRARRAARSWVGSSGARHHELDRVADRLEVLHVVALELDAVVVLDDLSQLDEVERVDVELLERRLARDLLDVGAEARERLDDARLDGLWGCGGCHGDGLLGGVGFQAAMPPSTDRTAHVT